MVRSRFALLIRGAAAGAIVALPAMLTGCVVDAVEQDEGEEDVAESASELDHVTVSGGLEEPTGDPQKDPDPVPWRPEVRGNDDPDPDPNAVAQIISTPGTGNSDNNK
jgi:hypothetical protein